MDDTLLALVISVVFLLIAVKRATAKDWVLSFIIALFVIAPYLIWGGSIGFDLHNGFTDDLDISSILFLIVHFNFIFSIVVFQP